MAFLTIIGVKEYRMAVAPGAYRVDYPIDKNILQLPEVYIEDFSNDIATSLKPLFDMIWNACGYERSVNYDEKGEWKGR